MDFVWESAFKKDYTVWYEPAYSFGPYSEVVDEKVDEEKKQMEITYNCLFRYDEIFEEMLLLQKENHEGKWVDFLFDACTHIAVKADSFSGMSRNEFLIRHLMRQICDGKELGNISSVYRNLDDEVQYQLASFYVMQNQVGESVSLYAKAVTNILQTGAVYKNSVEPDVIMVYLGDSLNDTTRQIWDIINYMFLPIKYKSRLFEQAHVAIWDENQTLYYEKIELF